MTDLWLLLVIGLFSGIFGGLLGIGGSIILLPALSILFAHRHSPEHQHLYQAAAMVMNFFVALPSAISHQQQKTLLWPILKWLIPAGIISIGLGVTSSNLPIFQGSGAVYLKQMLGLFLFYVLGYNLYRLFKQTRLPDVTPEIAGAISPWKTILGIGFPMGYSGGLLGIGGGILCVPLQQVLLKIPLHRAIANSSATIVWISLLGAVYKTATIPETIGGPFAAMKLALFVVPTSFVGGFIGARLIYILPRNVVRVAFCLLMFYAGFRLLFH
jgi:uncharacterized membrane protein YfcA